MTETGGHSSVNGERFCVQADWDSVPHLSKEDKEKLWNDLPPHQRDARSKGIPSLGAGVIYPVPESDIVVKSFKVPDYFKHCYAMDVGWNRTAALWGAWDQENDIVYIHSEYYRGEAEPATHAAAIRSRGKWMNGVIDPAARARAQKDGEALVDMYVDLGLNLGYADNSVESGIYTVRQRLEQGRLKFFSTLPNLLAEFRLYRRDEKGKIVKQNDHLMDCLRYLCVSGLKYADVDPGRLGKSNEDFYADQTRSGVTGY